MKYEIEYKAAEDREAFVYLVRKNHKVKKATAIRRYYDLRKVFGELPYKTQPKDEEDMMYPESMKSEPSHMKKMMLSDMKKLGHKLTRKFLRKYGFGEYEMNWLEDNGEEIIREKF